MSILTALQKINEKSTGKDISSIPTTRIADILEAFADAIPNTNIKTVNLIQRGTLEKKTYYKVTDDNKVQKIAYDTYSSCVIDVSEGERYYIDLLERSTAVNYIICTNAAGEVINSELTGTTSTTTHKNYAYTIPANGAKLYVSTFTPTDAKDFAIKIKTVAGQANKFAGKKLSVLGDSYSAFAGAIPSGNVAYYTGSNLDVTDVSQMWFEGVCDKLGMERLVVNAWSGSKVSNIDADTQNFTPMSDVSRCQALHTSEADPDVIIIWAGTNDFTKANATIGSYNGGEIPTTNDTFSNAYAVMLSSIQTRYPNAEIYCCSLPTMVRTKGITKTELNSESKSVADYNDVIRRLCDIFSCTYINVSSVGFNRKSAYPVYLADNATAPTHPNADGQMLYAEKIAKAMLNS